VADERVRQEEGVENYSMHNSRLTVIVVLIDVENLRQIKARAPSALLQTQYWHQMPNLFDPMIIIEPVK
jgi:hypothetical protein